MKPKARHVFILANVAVVAILVATYLLPERAEASNCSWPYSGSSVTVEYRWSPYINAAWKTAFRSSIGDWNGLNTDVTLSHNTYGEFWMGNYNQADGNYGLNQNWCSGSDIVDANNWGNLYYDNTHSANERRSISGHEAGHGLGLHHTGTGQLMYEFCCPSSSLYRPNSVDENDLNGLYTGP